MAEPRAPDPVKLFVSVITSPRSPLDDVRAELVERVGPLDLCTPFYTFIHTSYYEPEMGAGLARCFLALAEPQSPEVMVPLKEHACAIETKLARHDGRRVFNLDPGYVDFNKVVLASYKYGSHKVYLSRGVYADIVLLYGKGAFTPFAWTFPDFASGVYTAALLKLRAQLKAELRKSRREADERPPIDDAGPPPNVRELS